MLPAQGENNAVPALRETEIIMLLNAILPVWLRQLGSIKNQTEEAVDQLADSVSSIVKHFGRAGVSSVSGQVIRSDVDNLLLSLQYQDRVNQMLTVVIDDMSRLQRIITINNSRIPASDEWLSELSSRYTMHDERDRHQQAARNGDGGNAKPDSDEVTFF